MFHILYVLILFIMLPLSLSLSSFETKAQEEERDPKEKLYAELGFGRYDEIREAYMTIPHEEALHFVAEYMNTEQGLINSWTARDAERILFGTGTVDLVREKYESAGQGGSLTQEQMIRQRTNMEDRYDFEYGLAEHALKLRHRTLIRSVFLDGISFVGEPDLIIVMNEIDFILRGEKGEARFSEAALALQKILGIALSAGGDSDDSSLSQSIERISELMQDGDVYEQSSDLSAEDISPPDGSGDDGSSPDTTSPLIPTGELYCDDEHTITIDDLELQQALASLQDEVDQIEQQREEGDLIASPDDLNSPENVPDPGLPLAERPYEPLPDELIDSDDDDGFEWPCNTYFCIVISSGAGLGGASASLDGRSTNVANGFSRTDNSVLAHVTAILRSTEKMSNTDLSLDKAPREFFQPSQLDSNLADRLSLDVETAGLPVPSIPAEEEPNPEEIRYDLSFATDTTCTEYETQLTGAQASQEELQARITACQQERERKIQEEGNAYEIETYLPLPDESLIASFQEQFGYYRYIAEYGVKIKEITAKLLNDKEYR